MYSIIVNYGTAEETVITTVSTDNEFTAFIAQQLMGEELYTLLENITIDDISNRKYLPGKYLLRNYHNSIFVEKILHKGWMHNSYSTIILSNWKLVPDVQLVASIKEAKKIASEQAIKLASEEAINKTVEEIKNNKTQEVKPDDLTAYVVWDKLPNTV